MKRWLVAIALFVVAGVGGTGTALAADTGGLPSSSEVDKTLTTSPTATALDTQAGLLVCGNSDKKYTGQDKIDCAKYYAIGKANQQNQSDTCDKLTGKQNSICKTGWLLGHADNPDVIALKKTVDNAYKDLTGSKKDGCEVGYNDQVHGKSKADACGDFSGSKKSACEDSWDKAKAAADAAAGTTGDGSADSCDQSAGNLAWVLCPVIQLASDTFTSIFKGMVIDELKFQPLITTGGNPLGSSLYQIWGNILVLADVAFVFIFMYILLANMLSFGASAYTIKKMLPRLVAAAILVQASFLVCSLAIDLGNILGAGVESLTKVVVPATATGGDGGSIFNYLGAVIGVVLVAGALMAIGVPSVVLFAIAALFGILSVLITLILRKLVISVLIILSPLAFAAWVLPGTEGWFKTWWKTLIRVVLMYPLIVLIFSMATVLSVATKGDTGGGVASSSIQNIVSGLYPIIAFFLVPWTFKWAGGVMNATAGAVGKLSNRGSSGSQSKFKDSGAYKRMNQNRESSRLAKRQFLDNGLSKVPGLKGSGRVSRFARATVGGAAGFAYGAGTSNKLEQQRGAQKLVQDQQKELKDLGVTNPALLTAIGQGKAAFQTYAAAAKQRGEDVSHLAHYAGSTHGQAAALRTLAQDGNGSSAEAVRVALNTAPAGSKQRLAAEQVWQLGTADAGDLFGSDPGVAFGGLDAQGAVSSSVVAKTGGDALAKQMKDGKAISRTYGGDPTQVARRDDKGGASGTGTAGGSVFHLDTTAVEQSLSGPRLAHTTAQGRKALYDAFNSADATAELTRLLAVATGPAGTPEEVAAKTEALARSAQFIKNRDHLDTIMNADGSMK